MNPIDELRHINQGAIDENNYEGIGLILFDVTCPGNAESVLERSKEIMSIVVQQYQEPWPSCNEWLQLMPEWFVSKCAPELSAEEEKLELERWQKLSPEQQSTQDLEESWSLSEWISWFEVGNSPQEIRYWFWWDSILRNSNLFHVALEVVDVPFPWGSFDWLIRASGAIDVSLSE